MKAVIFIVVMLAVIIFISPGKLTTNPIMVLRTRRNPGGGWNPAVVQYTA